MKIIDQGKPDFTTALANDSEEKSVVVVRLSKSWYKTERGLAHRVELRYVRNLCKGFNGLEEDINTSGAQSTFENITNLHKCENGLYQVVFNPYRDWETGIVDDWDYSLVPFEKAQP